MYYLLLCILLHFSISVPVKTTLRCDDNLLDILINDVSISLLGPQNQFNNTAQDTYFEVEYGDKITFICKNGGGPTGIDGSINIGGTIYNTNNSTGYWSWNVSGVSFDSNFSGLGFHDNNHNGWTIAYHFQMPIYKTIFAEDFGFALDKLSTFRTSATKTIQFLNHIRIDSSSSNNLLRVVFDEIPFGIDIIKHLTPPNTVVEVQNNTQYSFNNNNIYITLIK